jgi:hypothetical protein
MLSTLRTVYRRFISQFQSNLLIGCVEGVVINVSVILHHVLGPRVSFPSISSTMNSGQKNSDTMSEISDVGTTGTSVSGPESNYGSNENLRELALELGLSGVNELYEERFRVDRKKLEHMILCKYNLIKFIIIYAVF